MVLAVDRVETEPSHSIQAATICRLFRNRLALYANEPDAREMITRGFALAAQDHHGGCYGLPYQFGKPNS